MVHLRAGHGLTIACIHVQVDSKLEASAAGIQALMEDIAAAAVETAGLPAAASGEVASAAETAQVLVYAARATL